MANRVLWSSLSGVGIVGLAMASFLLIPQPEAPQSTADDFIVEVDNSDMSLVCAAGPIDPTYYNTAPLESLLVGASSSISLDGATILTSNSAGAFPQALALAQAPEGIFVDECAPPLLSQTLVGASTSLEENSVLTMTNPGGQPVSVTVQGFGLTGHLGGPSSTLTIPALSTESWLLGAWFPDQELFGVTVESGGIGVRAWLQTSGADGEVSTGTARLAATPAANQQVFPLVSASAATPSLLLMNPGDTATTVSVGVLGDEEVEPLLGAEAVEVEAGSVVEVSLAGIGEDTFGIVLDSTTPVAASIINSIEGNPDPVVKKQKIWLRTLIAPSNPVTTAVIPTEEAVRSGLDQLKMTATEILSNTVLIGGQEYAALLVRAKDSAGVIETIVPLGVLSAEEATQVVKINPAP